MKIKFIVGINKRGIPVESSCDQISMFIKNKRIRKYLHPSDPHRTKVMFKREVLNKYLHQPNKYFLKHGLLECDSEGWQLKIDNDQSDHIMVFLGDLNDLPSYEEQCYWRSFNVPVAPKISKSAYGNAFECDFSDPEQPDQLFKIKCQHFNKRFEFEYGWPLFRELKNEDVHNLQSLTILPNENEQKQFDAAIIQLAKIMVDAINEGDLKKQKKSPKLLKDEQLLKERLKKLDLDDKTIEKVIVVCKDIYGTAIKGIGKLKEFLESKEIDPAEIEYVKETLKDLYDLRSTGAAHMKGSGYYKIFDKQYQNTSLQQSYDIVLRKCIKVIDILEKNLCTLPLEAFEQHEREELFKETQT